MIELSGGRCIEGRTDREGKTANAVASGAEHATADAYKDYRGVRNGIYYSKIKAAAEKLAANPESMQLLRDMVK